MRDSIIENLGPLAPLAGIWESERGIDTSRIHGEEKITKFKEKITFEPLGPVNNGPQALMVYVTQQFVGAWVKMIHFMKN